MPFRPGQKLPDRAIDLEGPVKAAVLLLSLDEESASAMLRELPTEIVQRVTAIVAAIDEVPANLAEEVVEEYYGLQMASRYVREGGLEYARKLLNDSLDDECARQVMTQVETQVQRTPFSFLRRVESDTLLAFIQEEHPQTIALIVSHLDQDRASEILVGLPSGKQVEVVRRVANMEQTNPALVQEVEAGLEDRLANMLSSSSERVGGIKAVAEVLNLCDRNTERNIMDGIETDSPDLVDLLHLFLSIHTDTLTYLIDMSSIFFHFFP